MAESALNVCSEIDDTPCRIMFIRSIAIATIAARYVSWTVGAVRNVFGPCSAEINLIVLPCGPRRRGGAPE